MTTSADPIGVRLTELMAQTEQAIARVERRRSGLNGSKDEVVATNDDATTFPLEVLPPAMRSYVDAGARSLSVPAEMVAVPMLGLAGSLIGNRLHVILKNSWREYPTLFVAVVSRPGTAKSPALNLAKWPLDALQEHARLDHKDALGRHEVDLAAWQSLDPAHRGPKPPLPKMRHLFSTDVTIEALVGILGSNPGAAIIRDEIGGWVASMDQYRGGKGSDRQQYLSLWSAGTIKADRKTGESIYVRHPVALRRWGDPTRPRRRAAQRRPEAGWLRGAHSPGCARCWGRTVERRRADTRPVSGRACPLPSDRRHARDLRGRRGRERGRDRDGRPFAPRCTHPL
jgi:hypothetical protein